MSTWKISQDRGASQGWASFRSQPLALQAVDVGLLLILLIAPFFMGGRQPLGQLVLCITATLTALAWCLHQIFKGDGRWNFTGVEPILLLGIGLIIFQCWELSPDLIASLSPGIQELLPQWQGGDGVIHSTWQRLSLTPYQTRSNLIVVIACLLFFFVAAQRIRTIDDLCRYLRVVALAGVMMSMLAMAQLLFGNGKFFWFYQHALAELGGSTSGAFTNTNHFANYVAMTLPAQLFLLMNRITESGRQDHTVRQTPVTGTTSLFDPEIIFWTMSIALTALAILLSQSQAGLISSFAGVLVTLLIFWHRSILKTKVFTLTAALGVLVVGTVLIFSQSSSAPAEQKLSELTMAGAEKFDHGPSRPHIWQANIDGIREFPAVGTGLGSHAEVYWLWFHHPHDGHEFSHAENGYLQIGLETGLVGLGLVALLWATVLLWCAQGLWNATSPRAVGVIAAVTAGLLISLIHSMADFVWYVPACVNLVLLYAICAWRMSLMRFSENPAEISRLPGSDFHPRKIAWMMSIPAVIILGAWMVQEKIPEVAGQEPWNEYLRLTLKEQKITDDEFDSDEVMRRRQIELVTTAAQANPAAHRVQFHAGLACLRLFALHHKEAGNIMPLAQLKQTAHASFQSVEELDQWLNRPGVLGEGRQYLVQASHHFRSALEACPLQPHPYLELADLIWLEGAPQEHERLLVEQAVTVRPCDARAQFSLGRLDWFEGNHNRGLAHWQEAFRLDATYRGELIASLSHDVPPAFFLDHFELDKIALIQLRNAYRESNDQSGKKQITSALAKTCVKDAMQIDGVWSEPVWILAHECFNELGDRRSAYHSAKEAVNANPSSFNARRILGMWLYDNQIYGEAVEHLAWCCEQNPDVEWLQIATNRAKFEVERNSALADRPDGTVIR